MTETTNAIIPEGKGDITQTAMLFTGNLDYDEWVNIGHQLKAMSQGLMFWVGDWLNYGEEHYGEMYAQAMDITGYSYRTVKQAKYIAKKFPPEARNDALSFTHYTAVAGEEPERAKALLDQAINESLTIDELKRLRKPEKEKPENDIPQTAESQPEDPQAGREIAVCPHCGQNYYPDDLIAESEVVDAEYSDPLEESEPGETYDPLATE